MPDLKVTPKYLFLSSYVKTILSSVILAIFELKIFEPIKIHLDLDTLNLMLSESPVQLQQSNIDCKSLI